MKKNQEKIGEKGIQTYEKCRLKVIQNIVLSAVLGIILMGFAFELDGFTSVLVGMIGFWFVIMATANLFRIKSLAEKRYNNQEGIRLNVKVR